MSSFTNSIYYVKSIIISECQRANNNTKATHRKKQVASLREGKFHCIYLIEENGQKILLNRIPLKRFKKPKNSGKPSKYSILASCDYKACPTFKYKQQMHIIAVHKQNTEKIMDILKGWDSE